MTAIGDPTSLLGALLEKAKKAGADDADAVIMHGISLGVSYRLGKSEDLQRSEGRDLGLRVLLGRRQAMVSTTDFAEDALDTLVERAIAMARAVPEDPYCGLIDPEQLARDWPDLELADTREPQAEQLIDWARRAEEAARAIPGVTNSEGGDAGWSHSSAALATSGGFSGGYETSRFSFSASVIAGADTGMERDYDWSSACFEEDLDSPEEVGKRAGERATRRLNPRKAASGAVPVVYDPRVSGGLIRHLAGAISGPSVARGTSFLKDRLHQSVFAPGIQVIDDPHRKRGLRSRPFDGEGAPTTRRHIVEDGVLATWLLDSRSARQLKMRSTGHAARGTGGPPSPSPSNLYLAPGELNPQALIADIESGMYVTELIGMGVNGVTGDYSRGAAGYWIDKGEIAWPVSELTVAGNLNDMFAHLTPANDLTFRHGIDAPTLRIDGMTVAGQ
ncbi:MAG: TldD/PmbA family protein [Proteobacteria bacterium]|nr:TldD/PmbA family protein [Pseudomonadota bacterium]MDA1355554.1 TldD/PmbA family protein [Pseudomonadota bacterium]